MAQNPSVHDGSGAFGHDDDAVRDVTENANMDLLCFHVKDDAGRTKFLAVNVLRAHEICSYGDDVRNALVSVGKAGSNGVVHGTFSHRGDLVAAVDLRAWMYGVPDDSYDRYLIIAAAGCSMAFLAKSDPDPFLVSKGNWESIDLRANPLYAGGRCERAARILKGPQQGALVDIVDLDQLVSELNPDHFENRLAMVQPVKSKSFRKILLVDDSSTARKQAARIFQHAGFHDAQVFNTPEDLLGHLKSVGPDNVGIVVTDLEMDRGMGGEGLIKNVRSDARFSGLPILVYSGMLDEHRIKEVLECGATDTADKGNPQDLVDKITLHALTR